MTEWQRFLGQCLFCPQLFSRQTTYFHLHTLSLLLERREKKSPFIDKDNIGVIANLSNNNQITLGVNMSKKNCDRQNFEIIQYSTREIWQFSESIKSQNFHLNCKFWPKISDKCDKRMILHASCSAASFKSHCKLA